MTSGLATHHIACSRGYRDLFADLCLRVQSGEMLRVEGRNGSGKTSLLRILAGLAQPVSGDVLWNGGKIHDPQTEYFQNLLYIGHKPGIKYELTAIENLCLSRALFGSRSENGIEEALYQIGLYGFEDMPAAMLSAGQKRRVALAQLFLTQAKLWILDEPYTSLDVAAVALLEEQFRLHVQAGGMLILTSHQPVNIAGCVTKRLALPDTKVEQAA
ncbi:MAG: heme exporter protein [Pseudomonadota bacterium]|nr:heme exporter protein [Pseudomonadota bacterium]